MSLPQKRIDFGNFRLPAIKVWKFNDLDGNGVKDVDERVLDGWQMIIDPAINGIGSCITAGGFCAFENLSIGQYVVTEIMQPGWASTTGVSQTIDVSAGSMSEVWFGNVESWTTVICRTGPIRRCGPTRTGRAM